MKRRIVLYLGGAAAVAAIAPSFWPNRDGGPVEIVETPLLTDPNGEVFVYRNGWIEKI